MLGASAPTRYAHPGGFPRRAAVFLKVIDMQTRFLNASELVSAIGLGLYGHE